MADSLYTSFTHIKYIDFPSYLLLSDNPSALSDINAEIRSGCVIIVRNVLPSRNIDSFISNVVGSHLTSTQDVRVLEGVPNIKYVSQPSIFQQIPSRYIAADISYYLFPWNLDDSGAFSTLSDVTNLYIKLNGYEPAAILSNTPKDRIILRFHLIHYPLGLGEISLHKDPDNIIAVNSGIYLSQYGDDYMSGGFFVIDHSGAEVLLDQYIRRGDMVLFSPLLAHGVHKISDPNPDKPHVHHGRYFFHISLVESHCSPNRQQSTGLTLPSIK
jgi:hypothetical protein